MKAYYRRITAQGIGPGGWRCPCCAPAPGKAKKLWLRLNKKKERKLFSDFLRKELPYEE